MIELDVHDDPVFKPHQGQPYLNDWLQANGIDPYSTYRVDVLPDCDGTLRVYQYHQNCDGRRHFTDGCDDGGHAALSADEICVLDPKLIPLRAVLPHELMRDAV